jgi:hypothetical protein
MESSSTIILGVVVVIVGYLLYLLYKWFNSPLISSTTLNIVNSPITIAASLNPASTRYSYGVWLYANTWDNAIIKPIFSRLTAAGSTVPQIYLYLDKTTPTLSASIAPQTPSSAIPPTIITDSFALQKWVFVLISVDNQFVDMYVDGKLVKSIKLAYLPAVPADYTVPVNLGSTGATTVKSDIFVANFQYWSTPQGPQNVWNTYMKGNGGSIFSSLGDYGATVTVTKNNATQAVIPVF